MSESGNDDKGMTLEERLEAAERAASDAQDRIGVLDTPTLETKVAEAERRAADLEAIADAKAKHGTAKIGVVQTELGAIVLKRPNNILFRRFQDLDEITIIETEKMVRTCLVHPDVAAFDRIIDEQPGILPQLGVKCGVLAGTRKIDLSKK